MARECVEAAGPSGRIACIACPSLFRQLRAQYPDANAHLFEVDLRFEVGSSLSYVSVLSESDACLGPRVFTLYCECCGPTWPAYDVYVVLVLSL